MLDPYKKSAVAAATALALGWGTAQADSYVGAGFGTSKMNDANTQLIGTSFDDKDSGFKLFGGFTFTPNVALELEYVDLGTFKGSVNGINTDSWEATAFNVAGLFSYPVSKQFSIFGKLGIALWNVDDTFVGINASESGADISYGVGAQFDFTKQVGARLEYQVFSNVGDEAMTGQSDVKFLSASVVVHLK